MKVGHRGPLARDEIGDGSPRPASPERTHAARYGIANAAQFGSLGARRVGDHLVPGPAQRLDLGLEDRVLTSACSVIGVSQ